MIRQEIFAVNVPRIAGNNENYGQFLREGRSTLVRLGLLSAEVDEYKETWEDLKQKKRG